MRYWALAAFLFVGCGQRLAGQAVVLHVTVMDKGLHPVTTLACNNFKVYENNVEQELQDCRHEDVPVSAGILVDSSGSMRDKRGFVQAAVLAFVKASNPQSEFFLVNFNVEHYLDSDFTSDPVKIRNALGKWSPRAGTAFYEALIAALDHLKKRALNSKRVLLVVGDGKDNESRSTQEEALATSRASDGAVYAIGLLDDKRVSMKYGGRGVLESLAEASGGAVAFPRDAGEAEAMASQLAASIRNQYVLSYVPGNRILDGRFRKIRVVAEARGQGKLTVRTRAGYYAGIR